jgi:DNA-binding winged helix-turn-helix (wHTH) protein/WD40 repeat protein
MASASQQPARIESNSSRQFIRFGVFELETDSGELRKQGIRIRLQAKPLQILRALLEEPAAVVTREELRRRLWPEDTFVDFERGLNTAVNRLRLALNDSAENPRYIETVARTGYRFIAPATKVGWTEPALAPKPEPEKGRHAYPLIATWVGLLVLVALGVYWAVRPPAAPASARYRQITFRRGQVLAARFAPDQQNILYAAQWEQDPRQLFITNANSPEARSLGFSGLTLGAVSRRGELALLQSSGIANIAGGTLSRISMNGGASQLIEKNITAVDWSADGARLAVVRAISGSQQLEFPIGRVLYRAAGWLSSMRLSPSNDAIAFIEHPGRHDDAGAIRVVDATGKVTTLSGGWVSAAGLAWNPHSDEIWFTASRENAPRSLWAVSRSGRLRAISQAPGTLSLRDITADGRALLSRETRRLEMAGLIQGESGERSFSWMDWSRVQELSADGGILLFDESGEGAGPHSIVYVRQTRSGETIRLGEGLAQGLSPDGKSALLLAEDRTRLRLAPVGGGAARDLPDGGLQYQWARFFPEGKRLLVLGSKPGESLRLYIQVIESGALAALTKPMMVRNVAISPDGAGIATLTSEGKLAIYPATPGDPLILPFTEPLAPLRWSADGQWLFVQHLRSSADVSAVVSRLNLRSGELRLWKKLAPFDPMGVNSITGVAISSNEQSYIYSYRRVLSELYLADGLR